jgi:ferredoxin
MSGPFGLRSDWGVMEITVDAEKCIASGGCVFACPEVFGQDDDGFVLLLQPNPSDGLASKINDAIDACPAAVIDMR